MPFRLTLSFIVAVTAIGCGPLVMIPGGQLSGEVEPAPSDWSFSDAIETVQLETSPDEPYSVNVWGVAAQGAFFIAAGDKSSQWAENIRQDSRVRLKVGEHLYAMTASETSDPSDLDAFLAAAKAKYDFEPDEDQRGNASLFRLTPR